MTEQNTTQKNIAIIGTGAVGTALAVLLHKKGYTISALAGRNTDRTSSLAKRLNVTNVGADNNAAIEKGDVIFFCLPDDSLNEEIKACANSNFSLTGKIFFHTSGVLTSTLFEPMRKKGAFGASFHPLQTIPRDGAEVSLKDFAIAVEGDQHAVDCAAEIINAVEAKPFMIEPEQKSMYHTTATLASNGLIGLSGVIEEMAENVGLGEEGRKHLFKLMEQSLENSRSMTGANAITGPAARGDIATLKQHLGDLRQYSPHLVPIYVVLGSHCVSLAIRSGKLSQERGEEIMDLFSNELHGLTV